MPISKPTLPPRRGYVEVELDGERRYRNAATGALLEDETEAAAPDGPTETEDTAAMLVDHEYRLTLMELGLAEGGEA